MKKERKKEGKGPLKIQPDEKIITFSNLMDHGILGISMD